MTTYRTAASVWMGATSFPPKPHRARTKATSGSPGGSHTTVGPLPNKAGCGASFLALGFIYRDFLGIFLGGKGAGVPPGLRPSPPPSPKKETPKGRVMEEDEEGLREGHHMEHEDGSRTQLGSDLQPDCLLTFLVN